MFNNRSGEAEFYGAKIDDIVDHIILLTDSITKLTNQIEAIKLIKNSQSKTENKEYTCNKCKASGLLVYGMNKK